MQAAALALIGGRYRVQAEIGSGGMASVYHVTDTATGRELAVKRLSLRRGDKGFSEASALFEREYHTLVALSHPGVVAVYDYGLDALGPFYTMELLDGGDLKEKSPCDWRTACALASEVCSALALVHSRRLTHGDVSPRNVRCTRDGHAKLIDFGALMPMGRCDKIVGTPAFVAPEVVSRLTSDARTDLYSLGATLYYALSGQLPYSVSDFHSLARAWQRQPLPPSHYARAVPPALDELVLSLLELEPSQRPRSPFEVMQRLAAIAGLAQPEQLEVAQAYLATPVLIGRDAELATLREKLAQALAADGGAVLITGSAGVGRSRMLDAAVTLAKTMGALVLRLADDRRTPLGAAHVLLEQLVESFPERAPQLIQAQPALAPLWPRFGVRPAAAAADGTDSERAPSNEAVRRARSGMQLAISELLVQVTAEQPVVIAADDLGRLDDASCGLLAGLAHGAQGKQRLLIIATEQTPLPAHAGAAREMLQRIASPIALAPLTLEQTAELLASMFGDVPNLALASTRGYEHTGGNPRALLDFLQYLVDEKLIRYARGAWTLPGALPEQQLPRDAAAMLLARIQKLPAPCRQLLLLLALAPHALPSRAELGSVLGEADESAHRELDGALYELLALQLVQSDGNSYALAHRAAGSYAEAVASASQLGAAHARLAALYRRRGERQFMVAKHALAAGERETVLAELLAFLHGATDIEPLRAAGEERPNEIAAVLARALSLAQELRRPARELCELRHWMLMFSVAVDTDYYHLVAADFRRTLEQCSGLDDYRALAADPSLDHGARLMGALTRASQRHDALPEAERCFRVDEAIKLLVRYVALSIAAGTKTNDGPLVRSLPGLLEPFAPLSPLIDAVWQNSIAVCESVLELKYQHARERWKGVLTRLPTEGTGELYYVMYIRRAIAYGLGLLEARLGLASASDWVAELDRDVLQEVSAMYLRKLICLQQGDLDGAESYRKQAELLQVRSAAEQMFSSSLLLELLAHAMARDVQGVKELRERIAPLAERYSGWRSTAALADGLFQRLIGKPELALEAFERCLELDDLERDFGAHSLVAWPAGTANYIETLVDLERTDEAIACGLRALESCQVRGIDVAAYPIVRSLAVAEARSGSGSRAADGSALSQAVARLDSLIEEQCALGIKGLQLAASYDARARVAVFMHDRLAFTRYAQLSAAEYAQGHGSALSARYAALMVEPRAPGEAQVGSTEFASTVHLRSVDPRSSTLERELAAASGPEERCGRALALLCELYAAPGGQLHLLRDEGLLQVASAGQHDFGPDSAARVLAYFERELSADAMTTQAFAEEDARAALARAQEGERMSLLEGSTDGQELALGVLLLAPGPEQPDLARVLRLSRVIAGSLLRAGDARGVRTSREAGGAGAS